MTLAAISCQCVKGADIPRSVLLSSNFKVLKHLDPNSIWNVEALPVFPYIISFLLQTNAHLGWVATISLHNQMVPVDSRAISG
jgi:hypothetical protein